jgi:hypothetical protein
MVRHLVEMTAYGHGHDPKDGRSLLVRLCRDYSLWGTRQLLLLGGRSSGLRFDRYLSIRGIVGGFIPALTNRAIAARRYPIQAGLCPSGSADELPRHVRPLAQLGSFRDHGP